MDKQQLNKDTGETEVVTIPTPDWSAIKPTDLGLDQPTIDFVEDIYYPTRLDYIAARALPGVVTGRSEKDRRRAPKQAVELAKELIEELDKTED